MSSISKNLAADSIQVTLHPIAGMMGPTAVGNKGMSLVLFCQKDCDFCNAAMYAIDDVALGNCTTFLYDMTNLSGNKIKALHNAKHFPVTMTPTFVLFCNEYPISLLSGWFGSGNTPGLNTQRIMDHFTKAMESHQCMGNGDWADQHPIDDDKSAYQTRNGFSAESVDQYTTSEQEHLAAAIEGTHTDVYWQKHTGM
jgi:hypothetical protein